MDIFAVMKLISTLFQQILSNIWPMKTLGKPSQIWGIIPIYQFIKHNKMHQIWGKPNGKIKKKKKLQELQRKRTNDIIPIISTPQNVIFSPLDIIKNKNEDK
jgi:hypothetical protein